MIECNDYGFFDAIHSLSDFEADVSVRFDIEFVFFHDFIRYEFVLDAEVLVVLSCVAKAEVFDDDAHVSGSLVCI